MANSTTTTGGLDALAEHGILIAAGSQIHSRDVSIGPYTRVNGPIVIKGANPCRIGRYCAFGDGIHIITNDHDMSGPNLQANLHKRHGFRSLERPSAPVIIGNNVWIGDGAMVLAGAQIGDGAVIGAGAVVRSLIPPFGVAVGVPARLARLRFADAIISQLEEIRWWDWSEERIARNQAFFDLDLVASPDIDLAEVVNP